MIWQQAYFVYFILCGMLVDKFYAPRRIVLSEKMNARFIIFYLIISIYSPKKENEAKRFCSKESIFYTANGLLYYNLTSSFFHKRPISYFPSLSETIFLRISYARFFSFVKRLLSVYDIVP